MENTEVSKGIIFPLGDQFQSEYFTGRVYLFWLVRPGTACPIGNVTFEPGCINSWHKHAGGQILLVTGGRGYYQEDEKPALELHAGDVVEIHANVRHWHGAARDSWFSHIAIEVRSDLGGATWLEPVDLKEYAKLK